MSSVRRVLWHPFAWRNSNFWSNLMLGRMTEWSKSQWWNKKRSKWRSRETDREFIERFIFCILLSLHKINVSFSATEAPMCGYYVLSEYSSRKCAYVFIDKTRRWHLISQFLTNDHHFTFIWQRFELGSVVRFLSSSNRICKQFTTATATATPTSATVFHLIKIIWIWL